LDTTLALTFTSAMQATQGGRRYQEDTSLLWPGDRVAGLKDAPTLPVGHALAVLGDGMGGHVGGAMASSVACTSFVRTFAETFVASETGLMQRLISTLEACNTALAERTEQQPMYQGMGTTLVAAYFAPHELGSGLSWVSVGDSLLYLWRRGDLARLNEDHSLAPELDKLAEAGVMSRQEADADPRRHFLRSALTGADIEMIDVTPRPLPLAEGDIVIVASDGLHTLEEDEVSRIVDQFRNDGVARIATALIDAVMGYRLPHQDNTTVIVTEIGPDG
jgi:PPM family protein phosphatase